MIRHIVLFRANDAARATVTTTLQNTLGPLRDSVPGVRALRVDGDPHRVEGHWDVALISEHDSWDALVEYQSHPDHLAALAVVNTLVQQKAVVDYEV